MKSFIDIFLCSALFYILSVSFAFYFSDDRQLLEACIKKNKNAWDSFVDTYKSLIYSAIIKTLKSNSISLDNDIADDIFQSVFVLLHKNGFKKLKQFKYQAKLSTWLTKTVINSTIDYIKSSGFKRSNDYKPLEQISHTIADNCREPFEQLAIKGDNLQLEKAMEQLSKGERLVIKLCLRGYAVSEIAAMLYKKENNISQIKNRAIKKLQEILIKI